MNKLKCAIGALVATLLAAALLVGLAWGLALLIVMFGRWTVPFIICAIASGLLWRLLYEKCMNYHKRGEK